MTATAQPPSIRLTVLSAQKLAPDVLQLLLQAERALPYREGQFLSLILPHGAARSYSMANATTRQAALN